MRKLRDGFHNFVVTDVNVITRRMGYLTYTKKSNNPYKFRKISWQRTQNIASYDFIFCVNLVKLIIWLAFVIVRMNIWG